MCKMKMYYDLHIHSALSPCGDIDMTPNNIVNMALLKGLDVIAVADHNTCKNVKSVMKAAGDKILVIPAMEIETSEEVHMLTLFPELSAAEEMERILLEKSNFIKNRPEIFGNQYIMNEYDEIIGEEERLLVTATGLDIYNVVSEVRKMGGVAIPAHIDRTSYSMLSNLGFIPPDLKISTVEITPQNREKMQSEYEAFVVISDSDAHYLGDISERNFALDISNKNICEILSKLLV